MIGAFVARESWVIRLAGAIVCGMLPVWGGAALATIVSPGYDLYETVTTYPGFPFPSNADFSNHPLPAGFFDPGSEPFDGTVILGGRPIGPGTTDTIIQRTGSLSSGQSGPIPIEIVALNLVSVQPFTVRTTSGLQQWNVEITIPTLQVQSPGTMVVQHNDPGGGTFNSFLQVAPLLTFTRVGFPTQQATTQINDPIQLSPFPSFWSHTPGPLDAHDATYPAGGFYTSGSPLGADVADGQILNLLLVPAVSVVPEAGAWLLVGAVGVGAAVAAGARKRMQIAK